jgi:hypothetical protein
MVMLTSSRAWPFFCFKLQKRDSLGTPECDAYYRRQISKRCSRDGQIHADQRPLVPRPEPTNKLSAEERAAVLGICNSEAFASLPPSRIVPKLADHGR